MTVALTEGRRLRVLIDGAERGAKYIRTASGGGAIVHLFEQGVFPSRLVERDRRVAMNDIVQVGNQRVGADGQLEPPKAKKKRKGKGKSRVANAAPGVLPVAVVEHSRKRPGDLKAVPKAKSEPKAKREPKAKTEPKTRQPRRPAGEQLELTAPSQQPRAKARTANPGFGGEGDTLADKARQWLEAARALTEAQERFERFAAGRKGSPWPGLRKRFASLTGRFDEVTDALDRYTATGRRPANNDEDDARIDATHAIYAKALALHEQGVIERSLHPRDWPAWEKLVNGKGTAAPRRSNPEKPEPKAPKRDLRPVLSGAGTIQPGDRILLGCAGKQPRSLAGFEGKGGLAGAKSAAENDHYTGDAGFVLTVDQVFRSPRRGDSHASSMDPGAVRAGDRVVLSLTAGGRLIEHHHQTGEDSLSRARATAELAAGALRFSTTVHSTWRR